MDDLERAEDIQEEMEKMMTPLPQFSSEEEKEQFITEVKTSGNVMVYNREDEPIGFIITKDYTD